MRTVYFKKQASFSSRFKRAVKTLNVGALVTLAHDIAKDYFAPFAVTDNNGTNILCWTMKDAMAWLPACADKAYILDTVDFNVIVKRIQEV